MKEKDPDDVDEELIDDIESWLDKNKADVTESDAPKQRLKCHTCQRIHYTSNTKCPFCGTKYIR